MAHELLWWGYEAARPHLHQNQDEESITTDIFVGMQNKLNEPDLDLSYNRYEPHKEWHVVKGVRTGKSCKRIDVVVRFTEPRPRQKFCFEAKRLKTNGHGIGDYIGAEGMGCYLNEDYAEDDPEAAMVGYIQSDDSARWFSELQKRYKRDNGNGLQCVSPSAVALQPIRMHSNITEEWQSEHTRPTRGNIVLYHIFLDCT